MADEPLTWYPLYWIYNDCWSWNYSMPGDKNVKQFELWVFDAETQNKVKVKTEKWQDLYSCSSLHR